MLAYPVATLALESLQDFSSGRQLLDRSACADIESPMLDISNHSKHWLPNVVSLLFGVLISTGMLQSSSATRGNWKLVTHDSVCEAQEEERSEVRWVHTLKACPRVVRLLYSLESISGWLFLRVWPCGSGEGASRAPWSFGTSLAPLPGSSVSIWHSSVCVV